MRVIYRRSIIRSVRRCIRKHADRRRNLALSAALAPVDRVCPEVDACAHYLSDAFSDVVGIRMIVDCHGHFETVCRHSKIGALRSLRLPTIPPARQPYRWRSPRRPAPPRDRCGASWRRSSTSCAAVCRGEHYRTISVIAGLVEEKSIVVVFCVPLQKRPWRSGCPSQDIPFLSVFRQLFGRYVLRCPEAAPTSLIFFGTPDLFSIAPWSQTSTDWALRQSRLGAKLSACHRGRHSLPRP